jgi:alcohol dehydrogenase
VKSEQIGSNWNFFNSTSIHFGRGARKSLGAITSSKKILAVASVRGRAQFNADPLLQPAGRGYKWITSVTENPGLQDIENAAKDVKGTNFDAIVAFGGGSAIDFAKGLCAMLAVGQQAVNLRSVIELPDLLDSLPLLPIYAIPTTAGTGSEVTPFATVWDHSNKKKLSLVNKALYPEVAIIDPALTDALPAQATFSSGLDALNQALESIWNKNSSPVTRELAARAVALSLYALPALHANLSDQGARDSMAEAALLAGICISQTKTSVCHSISYPLTARFGISHGIAVAFTMREVLSKCVAHDPHFFDVVLSRSGHLSASSLCEEIGRIQGLLNVAPQVLERAGGLDAILEFKHEMLASERANNFVLKVDEEFIEEVIRGASR